MIFPLGIKLKKKIAVLYNLHSLLNFFQYRYDDEKKRVVQEPVELAQEYRKFDLTAPWEQFPNFRESPAQEEIKIGEPEKK